MQEHDLSAEALSVKVDPRTGGITETDRITLRQRGKPGGWKVRLFEAVAKTSDCWVTISEWQWSNGQFSRDETAVLIGRPRDIEMAHYLFDYLTRELTRLQKEYGDARWVELREYAKRHGMTTHAAETDFSAMGRHPLRSKDSWIKGAVLSVVRGLERAKYDRDHTDAGSGLVVSKEGEKEAFVRWQRDVREADREGLTVDEVRSRREAREAAFRAQAPAPYVAKKETAKDRRANEAYWRKQDRMAATAARREAARTDITAYMAGMETGATIAPRPGIRPAEEQARRVGQGQR
jgi:hypothetical protein